LVVGQVRVTSEIIPEPKEFLFGLISSKKEVFRTWVSESKGSPSFDTLREKGLESLGRGEEEIDKVLTSFLGNRLFTIQDTFKEERQAIFQKLIQKEFDEHCRFTLTFLTGQNRSWRLCPEKDWKYLMRFVWLLK